MINRQSFLRYYYAGIVVVEIGKHYFIGFSTGWPKNKDHVFSLQIAYKFSTESTYAIKVIAGTTSGSPSGDKGKGRGKGIFLCYT